VDPQKPAGQNSAPQKGAEFPLDEARHLMFGGSLRGQKRFKLRSHDAVEDRLFR
jgi:hypothetical protein